MEKLISELDNLVAKSSMISTKGRRSKVLLYVEGLKAKLTQVEYSLASLEQFTNRSDDTESSTEENNYPISMQVNFYCDAFWTFLYSSLDVLAQVINQVAKLDLKEENVSFIKVLGKLSGKKFNATKFYKEYKALEKSHHYRNLDRYRNCSTHRRQIYILEIESSIKVKETPGYSTTASSKTTVKRVLCDNPLAQNPKTDQERLVPDYMCDTKEKVVKSLSKIIKAMEIAK